MSRILLKTLPAPAFPRARSYTMSSGPNMRAAATLFFTSPAYAVAGASSQSHKFGYKIFDWYRQHDLHAVPLNPNCPTITIRRRSYDTLPSPSHLPDPKNTSLSVITPPPVTAQLLREAKGAGIKAVWLQPGSFTEKEMEYALEAFPGAAVGGFSEGTRGGEGWCVLVDGEKYMDAAKREGKL